MPNYCIVSGCMRNGDENVSMFSPPKTPAEFEEWEKALSGKIKRPLKQLSKVCEKHFDPEYFDCFKSTDQGDGTTLHEALFRKKLKRKSVPFTPFIHGNCVYCITPYFLPLNGIFKSRYQHYCCWH